MDFKVAPQADFSMVHISMQQRHGKKCLTFIQGLPEAIEVPKSRRVLSLDFMKILRALKKTYRTGGKLITDSRHGKVIQLQGDLRKDVEGFLAEDAALVTRSQIKIH